MKQRLDIIGKPRRRVDGRAKATGQVRYADDLSMPRMLFTKLLRSPHPHAVVESIDAASARKHPGVHLVLTGQDFPIPFGIMPVSVDEYPLARERVRYVGDPVAAVVAVDEQTAVEAIGLIDVRYRLLKPIEDPQAGQTWVVTSDRRLAEQARAAGAAVEGAEAFRRRVERAYP